MLGVYNTTELVQQEMANAACTNTVSVSQDHFRFSHLPIPLLDFSQQVWRKFSFLTLNHKELLVRGKCWEKLGSSEGHSGAQMQLIFGSLWPDPTQGNMARKIIFSLVSCGSLQSSAVLAVGHMNQFTQNPIKKFSLCWEYQLSIQQSLKASRRWMHGLRQPILTFFTIIAVNTGKSLLILGLWVLTTWKNTPLYYW